MPKETPFEDEGAVGRRGFLTLAGGAGVALSAPAIAKKGGVTYTSEVGRKFYPDGRVHPFRGNTIICHLDQQGPNSTLFEALLDIYRQFPALSFARKMTPLPPSSYHMTIFGGANDAERRPGLWPSSIPLNTPIEECTRILGERLKAANLGPIAPIRMRVDPSAPLPTENPMTIRLLPADDSENRRLRQLRNELSAITGIRAPSHDAYRFHVTLGYLIRQLSDVEIKEFRNFNLHSHQGISKKVPEISLGNPEYCELDDMFHFRKIFYI